jgi:hypothetical protein
VEQYPAAEPEPNQIRKWASGRAKWVVGLVAAALVSATAGTIYVLALRPEVERLVVGESQLRIEVLGIGDFFPPTMLHSGVLIIPAGMATPEQVPDDAKSIDRYARYLAWAQEHGAVAGSPLPLQVTVRGRTDKPVILNGFDVEIVTSGSPVDGWFRYPDLGCGGVMVRTLQFDLDSDRPVPMVLEEDGSAPKRMTDVFKVTSTDPEVFQILATTARHDVEFRLWLRYQSESGSGHQEVGTFRVSALTPELAAYDLLYDPDTDTMGNTLERMESSAVGC